MEEPIERSAPLGAPRFAQHGLAPSARGGALTSLASGARLAALERPRTRKIAGSDEFRAYIDLREVKRRWRSYPPRTVLPRPRPAHRVPAPSRCR